MGGPLCRDACVLDFAAVNDQPTSVVVGSVGSCDVKRHLEPKDTMICWDRALNAIKETMCVGIG